MKGNRRLVCVLLGTVVLASCSFGPHLQSALPTVRDVPVLAGLSPTDSLGRARAYLASRQFGLAIELYRTASRDPALEVESLNGLAIAYDGIGRADLAERYFQKALALRADDDRTRRNLATFYQSSGQTAKRQALLAERAVVAKPHAVAADEDRAPSLASVEPVTPAANPMPAAGTPRLRQPSPLDEVFHPLLVDAGYRDESKPSAGLIVEEGTVVCVGAPNEQKSRPGAAPMRMFRISVGEVFIAAQPEGTICSPGSDSATMLGTPEGMSNKEYLGLVAAYLDQFNRLHYFADLAMPSAIRAS